MEFDPLLAVLVLILVTAAYALGEMKKREYI